MGLPHAALRGAPINKCGLILCRSYGCLMGTFFINSSISGICQHTDRSTQASSHSRTPVGSVLSLHRWSARGAEAFLFRTPALLAATTHPCRWAVFSGTILLVKSIPLVLRAVTYSSPHVRGLASVFGAYLRLYPRLTSIASERRSLRASSRFSCEGLDCGPQCLTPTHQPGIRVQDARSLLHWSWLFGKQHSRPGAGRGFKLRPAKVNESGT